MVASLKKGGFICGFLYPISDQIQKSIPTAHASHTGLLTNWLTDYQKKINKWMTEWINVSSMPFWFVTKVFFLRSPDRMSQPRITYDGVPVVIIGKHMYDCHQGINRHEADVKRQNWLLARIFIINVFWLMSTLKMNGHKFIIISHSVKIIISQLIISHSFWRSYLTGRISVTLFLLWWWIWHGDRYFYVYYNLQLSICIFPLCCEKMFNY